jgi:ATP-dependent DNA helicase DinG
MGARVMERLWDDRALLEEICAPLGLSYRPRKEQQLISSLVTEALRRGAQGRQGVCFIEAGTGVGKTLGYMLPGAVRIAASRGRMLVSTHTLALMRQIVEKDGQVAINFAERVSGRRLRIAQLRGRRNFASPSRCRAFAGSLKAAGHPKANYHPYLELAEHAEATLESANEALESQSGSTDASIVDATIKRALLETFELETGLDLAREDVCLLGASPLSEQAAYALNRRTAQDAEILVTTHASIAISLMTKSFPVGSVNGGEKVDLLVVDEADQWASSAASVAMIQISLETAREALREMTGALRGRGLAPRVDKLASDCVRQLDELSRYAPKTADAALPIPGDSPVFPLLARIGEIAETLASTISREPRDAPCDPGAIHELAQKIGRLLRLCRSNEGFWSLQWRTSRMLAKPSLILQAREPGRLLKRIWDEAGAKAGATVLTSATLAVPGFNRTPNFQNIRSSIGLLQDKESLIHADLCTAIHPAQFGTLKARFAHPRAPAPCVSADGTISRDFLRYCAEVIREARSSGKRVLVLAPAYSDIPQLADMIPGALLHHIGAPLKPLLEAYESKQDACLITPAGWVGLDLPGLVPNLVIARLPFPPRSQESPDPFSASLGAMLIKLSQGVGRAIRRPEDEATLWFADPRMPPPCALADRHMIAPHPLAQAVYLSAIPFRFRARFETEPELAEFVRASLPAPERTHHVKEWRHERLRAAYGHRYAHRAE